MDHYDIFISYKRKSESTAYVLHSMLKNRGYSIFYDCEEMKRGNFDSQLLNYIENAKDVFVILEEGSLDACKCVDWEKDWFCHEIAFALEKNRNIIPILLNDYKMPPVDFFPKRLRELSLKNAPEFSLYYFDAYLDKLIEKGYLISEPYTQKVTTGNLPKSDVFICHSIHDRNIVEKLCILFNAHSITYFDDKQAPILSEGIDCDTLLKRKIQEAKIVVYLSSESANRSSNVKDELKYCMRCHKRLITLKLDTMTYKEVFSNYIQMFPKIDTTFYNKSVEKELVERIIRIQLAHNQHNVQDE